MAADEERSIPRERQFECTSEIPPHLNCLLCSELFSDAVSVCEEGHTVCRGCITRAVEASSKSKCPICRGKLIQKFVKNKNRHFMNEIHEQLLFVCSFAGCREQATLNKMKAHQKDCVRRPTECEHEGCDVTLPLPFEEMNKHESECEHQRIPFIGCEKAFKMIDLAVHEEKECPERMVECPNAGCAVRVRAKMVSYHRAQCPEECVQCVVPGCEWRGLREEQSAHGQSCALDHVATMASELARMNERMKQQNKRIERQNKRMKQQDRRMEQLETQMLSVRRRGRIVWSPKANPAPNLYSGQVWVGGFLWRLNLKKGNKFYGLYLLQFRSEGMAPTRVNFSFHCPGTLGDCEGTKIFEHKSGWMGRGTRKFATFAQIEGVPNKSIQCELEVVEPDIDAAEPAKPKRKRRRIDLQ